jgi:hypothetical protein
MRARRYNRMNRTICAVLEEIRKCNETRNYSYLSSLVEEAQTMANRMESALWDQKDLTYRRDEYKKLKAEVEALEEQKKFLEKK